MLVACMGTGTDVLAALREGYDVVGVDYSQVMFNGARSRLETFLDAERQVAESTLALYLSNADVNEYLQQGRLQEAADLAELARDVDARLQLIMYTKSKLNDFYDYLEEPERRVMDIATHLYIR